MKRNSLILLAVIALCATILGFFERTPMEEQNVDIVPEKLSQIQLSEKKPHPKPTAEPRPESAQHLSYIVDLRNNQVEFKLTNKGETTYSFYSDTLAIRGLGVPGHADVQVLKEDGALFDDWDSQISVESWSPLLVSSYARTKVPAEPQAIKPGETRSLVIPLENFFFGSKAVFDSEDYKVRVISRLYLDPYLKQSIKSRTDWRPLKLSKGADVEDSDSSNET